MLADNEAAYVRLLDMRAEAVEVDSPSTDEEAEELEEGSYGWYVQRLNEKVSSSSNVTTEEVVYFLLSMKVQHRSMTRDMFEKLCLFTKLCLLPEKNSFPTSFHLAKKLIGAGDWSDYEYHVCSRKDCAGHVWDHLPNSQWIQHRGDMCPKCQGPRFKSTQLAGELCNTAQHLLATTVQHYTCAMHAFLMRFMYVMKLYTGSVV